MCLFNIIIVGFGLNYYTAFCEFSSAGMHVRVPQCHTRNGHIRPRKSRAVRSNGLHLSVIAEL